MAQLHRIDGLPAASIWVLRTRTGLSTVEAIWQRLATPRLAKELVVLAKLADLPPERLREILADDAADRILAPQPFGKPGQFRRHLPDTLAFLFFLALGVALWFALARVPSAQQALVTATALSPDWVLTKADLASATVRGGENIGSVADVVGHVVLRPLVKGELLRKTDLGPQLNTPAILVRLPLSAHHMAIRPGQIVSLVVPLNDEHREVVDRALVLRVEGEAVTVALDATDRAVLARMAPGAAVTPFWSLGTNTSPWLEAAPARP